MENFNIQDKEILEMISQNEIEEIENNWWAIVGWNWVICGS